MAGNFIQGAIKHPGQLHTDLGVPQGQPIPPDKLAAAARGDFGPKVAQRARFAKTLKGLNKRKNKGKLSSKLRAKPKGGNPPFGSPAWRVKYGKGRKQAPQ